jgi:hypothetical protein
MDVDGYNSVWAVWDSGSLVGGTAEILYSKLDSLGGCLIPETPVSNNPTFSHLPRVAVGALDNVHVIWRDDSPQGDGIWHAKLANDGSVIVPSHLAVGGAGGGSSTLLPEMVINKYNELYIVWDEHPSGNNQMNFTRLDSLGNPIIDKILVSLPDVYAFWPGIGIDSFANAHIAYRSDSGAPDRLTYSKLDRTGNILISNYFLGTGYLPTLIADRSQNIHVVYADPAGPGTRIEYLKLDQSGTILIGPLTLSMHEDNFVPHMAMDSLQYMHVVWSLISGDSSGLMYTKIDTLGNLLIPPTMVVGPPYGVYPWEPRIAVDQSNRIHLIWKDQRLNAEDIFYKRGENEPGIEEVKKDIHNVVKLEVYPNPFSQHTNIRLQMPCDNGGITLRVFDITGREVRDFERQISLGVDQSPIKWDGTDNQGNRVPAGVYFLRCSCMEVTKSLPIVLLK